MRSERENGLVDSLERVLISYHSASFDTEAAIMICSDLVKKILPVVKEKSPFNTAQRTCKSAWAFCSVQRMRSFIRSEITIFTVDSAMQLDIGKPGRWR